MDTTDDQDSIGFHILRAIRRIIRRTTEHSRAVHHDSGLSIPQMLCLRAIHENSSGTRTSGIDIAAAVQLSPATVSRILDRLETWGFIQRVRDTRDRRRFQVTLTETGLARVRSLPVPLHEQFLRKLNELPSEERQHLLDALERIVELMGADEVDASPLLLPEYEVKPSNPSGDSPLTP